MRFIRSIATLVLAGTLLVSASGCSSEKVDATTATAIIDVRTPAEFASGHLQGAVNFDIEGGNFASQVATLDKNGTYLLYCHSGRRAGIALEQMLGMGFTKVTNLGGLEDAAAVTSLAIVQ